MEKIKLVSGEILNLITCGITKYNDIITINFIPENNMTLSDYEKIFSDKNNTNKLTLLSMSDEEIAIYSKYTVLTSISKKKDQVIHTALTPEEEDVVSDVVVVMLRKQNEIEERLDSLETQMTDTQMAMCEIYEGMVL